MCYEHLLLSLSRAELFHRFVESSLLRLSVSQATEKKEEKPNSSRKENSKKADLGGLIPIHYITYRQLGFSYRMVSCRVDSSVDINMVGVVETLIGVSKGCLSSACELAQRSISQLLTLRKDTTSKQLSIEKVRKDCK